MIYLNFTLRLLPQKVVNRTLDLLPFGVVLTYGFGSREFKEKRGFSIIVQKMFLIFRLHQYYM